MNWTVAQPISGDIIRTKVTFYHHYGIFISEDEVIQFGLPDDPGKPAEQIHVLKTDIDRFLNGGELEIGKPEADELKKLRSKKEIVRIARSRIGEGGYDILHNNCEHFVFGCAFGESSSPFLDRVRERIRKKLNKA